jgi:hypothetical protein
MKSRQVFRLWYGLLGALLCGSCGILVVVVSLSSMMLWKWNAHPPTDFDRNLDLTELQRELPWPIVGASAVLAATGFANCAVSGHWRFVKSLLIVFVLSVLTCCTSFLIGILPTRYRGVEHPSFYLSELIMFIGAPFLIGFFLVVYRIRCSINRKTST